VAVAFGAYCWVYVTDSEWKKHGDIIWREKFTADIDPYLEQDKKTVEYIDSISSREYLQFHNDLDLEIEL
jgi:hypothetical protein